MALTVTHVNQFWGFWLSTLQSGTYNGPYWQDGIMRIPKSTVHHFYLHFPKSGAIMRNLRTVLTFLSSTLLLWQWKQELGGQVEKDSSHSFLECHSSKFMAVAVSFPSLCAGCIFSPFLNYLHIFARQQRRVMWFLSIIFTKKCILQWF